MSNDPRTGPATEPVNQPTSGAQLNHSSVILTATAIIVAALVIMQAGRLPSNPAYADQATGKGDYSLVTTTSGRGGDNDPWEILYVIDSRSQTLMVYQIDDSRTGQIHLRDGGSLANLFRRARP